MFLFLKAVFALAATLGLFGLGVWAARRWGPKGLFGNPQIVGGQGDTMTPVSTRPELGTAVTVTRWSRAATATAAISVLALAVLAVMAAGLAMAARFTTWAEDEMYADPVVFSETTPYQRIVVTRGRAGFQLFLNGNLQFASADEYRYHEALVHPAMMAAEAPPRRARRSSRRAWH